MTKQSSETLKLSIIITAHNEGLIAHKTILSLIESTKPLEQKGITYEFIASIDNGDDETLDYFHGLQGNLPIKLLEVSFKDLSASRNNAVKNASGEFITFLDADDLVSENWLIKALETIDGVDSKIVHPEYSVTFGDDNLIWRKRASNNPTLDALILVDNNLWDSPCMAHRSIFLRHPYFPNGNGFGYEDKKFNSDTLSDNIDHVVAEKTILFVRRKIAGSMLRGAVSSRVTVAPTQLLSYASIRALDISDMPEGNTPVSQLAIFSRVGSKTKHVSRRAAGAIHRKAQRFDVYNKAVSPLREARQARILASLSDLYPEWMTDIWRAIHKIDNGIFPAKELLKSLPWYNAENSRPGLRYVQLVQSFTKKPDTLFFLPHLIKGGADLVFINYANQLQEAKGWDISVLQTEAKKSLWGEKLNSEIDFVNLYKTFADLDQDTQHRLIATLVAQNDIKRIIVGNSQLAYNFIENYGSLLKNLDVAIYCFAFGEEFDDEGRLWGHIHTGIPRIYPLVTRIVTDNQNTVSKLVKEYAFSAEKFSVHYQPTSAKINPSIENDNKPLKVLWASRVCKQKRPDIMKRVSNLLDPSSFSIDAWGQLEEGLTEEYFNDSKVRYRGPFNGMQSLPTSDYDMYLYTSEGDGVPNVLQEITAAGLPIIASNVGGIKEFIRTDETGYLVVDHENIDDYVSAINLFSDSEVRKKMNHNAQKLLKTQFSREKWAHDVDITFYR